MSQKVQRFSQIYELRTSLVWSFCCCSFLLMTPEYDLGFDHHSSSGPYRSDIAPDHNHKTYHGKMFRSVRTREWLMCLHLYNCMLFQNGNRCVISIRNLASVRTCNFHLINRINKCNTYSLSFSKMLRLIVGSVLEDFISRVNCCQI